MEGRRLVWREKNVTFEFSGTGREPVVLTAADASSRAARFTPADADLARDFKIAALDLSGRRFVADSITWAPSDPDRPDTRIAAYVTRPATSRNWFSRILRVRRRTKNQRDLYRRANLIRRSYGRVSRIHLYEAQGYFVYLEALVDFYAAAHEKLPLPKKSAEACLSLCRQRLDRAKVLLSRLQQDLNFLWREMAQVYTMLLIKVIPDGSLAAHLDFCAEDAKRLALDNDPEVAQMLQRAAELKDAGSSGESELRRVLRALIERYTRIRTGRIHDQFVNINSYRKALLLLAPIALLLIMNADLFLPKPKAEVGRGAAEVEEGAAEVGIGAAEVEPPKQVEVPKQVEAPDFEWLRLTAIPVIDVPLSVINHVLDVARRHLEKNMVAFVFFAGLLGGFFSVTIRLRSRRLVPGEDAYFAWYVLTKPFVGAVGATVFFLILEAGFVSISVAASSLMDAMDLRPGPVEFAFGFIAGFSERLVFPQFGEGSTSPAQ